MGKIVIQMLSISLSVLFILLSIYGLYELGLVTYEYGYRVFTEKPMTTGDGKDKLVQVTGAMSTRDIGERLQEKGLIRDKWLFCIQVALSDYGSKLQPGKYTLNTSMTVRQMLEVMSGETEEEEASKEGQAQGEGGS